MFAASDMQALIIPLLALIFGGGGVAAFFMIKPQSGVLIGQSAKAITEAATELVAPLRAELAEERRINRELRVELADQRERMARIEEQILVVHGLERDRDRLAVRVKQLETALSDAGLTLPPELPIVYHEETDLAADDGRKQ
jgi:hypothetical protein